MRLGGLPVSEHPIRQTFRKQIAQAVDAGDGDIQVLGLRRALAAEPRNLDARKRLAGRYAEMGFPELALDHYRLAAAQFPEDSSLHIEVARQLRALDLPLEGARLLYQFCQNRSGVSPEVYAWAGILFDESGDLASGESAHRKAIELAPEPHESLYNNLGYNLFLQGRSVEAQAEFRRALEIAPRSEVARANLAGTLGNSTEALAHWQSILGPSAAHNNLGAVLIEQGKYQEARKELNIALGYKPDNASALHNLALVSQLDGQPAVLPMNRIPTSMWRKLWVAFSGEPADAKPAVPVRAARK
jgi:tetratricopeptide (TPR) repeat protein